MEPIDNHSVEDEALLRQFVTQASQIAFTQLYERYHIMVWKLCLKNAYGDQELAEDAFQQTFLKLALQAGKIRSLSGWLFKTAIWETQKLLRSKLQQAERKQKKHARLETQKPDSPPEFENPESISQAVQTSLCAMPQKYQELLVLYHFQGKTQKQIAKDLGYPLTTIQKRLFKARTLLRFKLTALGLTASHAQVVLVLGTMFDKDLFVPQPEYFENALQQVRSKLTKIPTYPVKSKVILGGLGVFSIALILLIGLNKVDLSSFGRTQLAQTIQDWKIIKASGAEWAEIATIHQRQDNLSWSPLLTNQILDQLSKIRTNLNGDVMLAFDSIQISAREATIVNFMPRSALKKAKAQSSKPKAHLYLESGALCVEVDEDEGSTQPMIVDTINSTFILEHGRFFILQTDQFARLENCQGRAWYQPKGSDELHLLDAGYFVALGEGISQEPKPGIGRELSPLYGGGFFRETANAYKQGLHYAQLLKDPQQTTEENVDLENVVESFQHANPNLHCSLVKNKNLKFIKVYNQKENQVFEVKFGLKPSDRMQIKVEMRSTAKWVYSFPKEGLAQSWQGIPKNFWKSNVKQPIELQAMEKITYICEYLWVGVTTHGDCICEVYFQIHNSKAIHQQRLNGLAIITTDKELKEVRIPYLLEIKHNIGLEFLGISLICQNHLKAEKF